MLLNFELHLLLLRLSLLRLFVESLVAFEVFFFQALFANLSASRANLGLEVMLRFSLTGDLMACLLIRTFRALHSLLRSGHQELAAPVDLRSKVALTLYFVLYLKLHLLDVLIFAPLVFFDPLVPRLEAPNKLLGNFAHSLWSECAVSELLELSFPLGADCSLRGLLRFVVEIALDVTLCSFGLLLGALSDSAGWTFE